MRVVLLASGLGAMGNLSSLTGAAPAPKLSEFRANVEPALKAVCVGCHGPEKQKGKFRLDTLDPDLLKGPDADRWLEVFDVVSNSEMPPEGAEIKLTDADRSAVVDWLAGEIQRASRLSRDAKGRSSFRRLTRYEYDYALQDLLGLDHPLAGSLPPETASEEGFKNSSELLQMSPMQFQAYRSIGLKALRRAIVVGERPKAVKYVLPLVDLFEQTTAKQKAKVFSMDDESYSRHRNRPHLLNRETGMGVPYSGGMFAPIPDSDAYKAQPSAVVYMELPRNHEWKVGLDRFLPDEGTMRVSIRAARSNAESKGDVCLRLGFSAHTSNNANFSNVISRRDVLVDAPADKPEFVHFDVQLSDIQRNPFRNLDTAFPRRDEFLHIKNVSLEEGLPVQFDHVEITAPHYEQWPPTTHKAIFFESENREDEALYAREVLERFMERAWCRPVTTKEVDRFMDLFAEYRLQFESLEEAMPEVLATVLAHPEFLYLTRRVTEDAAEAPKERVSDSSLARRLAVFLWASLPDDELIRLAAQGKLSESHVLAAQVERMLADPRAERFSRHFVGQWLGLDALDAVDHVRDDLLKAAMRDEPVAFFEEVLEGNGSVMDFIHSDYAVINARLASHYGIRDVHGVGFRKVLIDAKSNRGGLLTVAAVSAMNSDGKDSHPLKRGVWMLERILHDPPPPPPPNVPEVDLADPNIAKMTLKERIADHRDDPACHSCHARIDPWGIAFENYDAFGRHRTRINNKPIDATSELFNKQILNGMDGLKRYLLEERQDQFARAMVHKLTAYALGRRLTFADHADLEELMERFRNREDRLRDLVHLLVQSPIFSSE